MDGRGHLEMRVQTRQWIWREARKLGKRLELGSREREHSKVTLRFLAWALLWIELCPLQIHMFKS